ncbi:MAG: methionine--tRNA ligase [Bacteroidetes bacterium]|nr:methionine--tRNA ligase [Bacteroidota bacterium]MDA0880019.1 methionine--tRNA ligase [Bacteroidota bacterium]MDA1116113.1 methionine--tRNA ligase [Bacteroidota bacterium]
MSKRYTVTAALPYTNGPIHIGHLAGVYVPSDIFVRYLRLRGRDVVFICGSDEHGVPITIRAKKEGKTPQELVDFFHKNIKDSFEEFGISFDNYSRTSSQIHHDTASEFFANLNVKGKFEETESEQLFDPEAQQFLADRFVVGTCPKCGNLESYGDQCERCGTSHNATDLINPKSTLSGSMPIVKSTKHWFLPLNEYADFFRQWILEDHKSDWKPNVYGQCKSWIDDGLKPRAVTRDLDWGVPVPVSGAEGKVLYVWFDAPIGYISSTKEWAKRENKDWRPYWQDAETELIHFIGKDNIVFHCIIFPAMLKAEGSYILPTNVPANEFLNLEGQKLSTSKNWAVWLPDYLVDFPGQQDVLRYVLTANAPESKDNDFTWSDFQARNNNELVAIFGNFVNRVAVLNKKYYDNVVPACGELLAEDKEVLNAIKSYPQMIGSDIENYKFRAASQSMMNLARMGNKYLADAEPWKVIKTDPERVQTILFIALQIASALAVLSEPFIPKTAAKLKASLNFNSLELQPDWDLLSRESITISTGHALEDSSLLFDKIDDQQIEGQLQKLDQSKKDNLAESRIVPPKKPQIPFENFGSMDLRVGVILQAEKMPKANKLLILRVDIGLDVRTIVSGIAEHYQPEEVIGKKVTVLTNLEPRTLRGVESQGMILMTENQKGQLVFVNPEDENAPIGGEIA